MQKLYSATAEGNKITIFDITNGSKVNSVSFSNEIIINGPVVTNNLMCVIIKDKAGKMKGKVYNLPNATLKYSYTVN